jgi:hypothetical protein
VCDDQAVIRSNASLDDVGSVTVRTATISVVH